MSTDRETLSEVYKPLQDTLIKHCVEITDLDKSQITNGGAISKAKGIWSKMFPKPQRSWLPTGCLVSQMLNCFVSIPNKPSLTKKKKSNNNNTQLLMLCLDVQKLLEVLHGVLPKMSLIASDFSYLPDVTILGERAPLVSTKVHLLNTSS